MNQQAQKLLKELLTIFNAKRLGEGDTAAGANLLAAMACSLAGMQLRGSVLTAEEDSETQMPTGALEIDTHLIASGAHSAALLQGKVIERLAMMHNRLKEEVENFEDALKADVRIAMGSNLTKLDAERRVLCALDIADRRSGEEGGIPLIPGMRPQQIPLHEKTRNVFDLLRHPMILIAATSSQAKFEALIGRSNEARPILHAALSRPDHFAQYAWQCTAVMVGLSCPTSTRFIRGTVMASDPHMLLGEAVREGNQSAAWAGRMLWLVDGQAGPCAPDIPLDPPQGAFHRSVEFCYGAALQEAWDDRVCLREVGPSLVSSQGAWTLQHSWLQFLRNQEPGFPGITAAARNLFATLVLGLHQMALQGDQRNRPQHYCAHAYALAMFLVLRMVNHRQALLHDAESARHSRLRAQLLDKLGDGAVTHRELSRRFHRLSSQLCESLLLDLEAEGLVRCEGRLWFPGPRANGGQSLTLEVNA